VLTPGGWRVESRDQTSRCHDLVVDYPEQAARTNRFSRGAPRAVSVGADGARIVFLRSAGPTDPTDRLWVYDVTTGTEREIADPAVLLSGAPGDLPAEERSLRERRRLSAGGVGSYATDPNATVAAFALAGRLFRADLRTGAVAELPATGPVVDPRPDPTGRRVAYVSGGALRVITEPADGGTGGLRVDSVLAGEPESSDRISWGLADFIAAEEFGRFQGYWWAPDGSAILATRVDETRVPRWHLHDPADPSSAPTSVAYPCAGAPNAEVTLHLLDLDGGWVDVHWDREVYPYLVSVRWGDGGPLITVLRRLQQHGLVLAVDPRTGETQVHAELADPRWVEPIPGTPCYLPDGRVLVGGELAHDGYDARCLFADGTLLTPPSLYVRRVCGRLASGTTVELLVEASEGEPAEQHLYLVRTAHTGGIADARRISPDPGWHVGHSGGSTLVAGWAGLDHAGTQWTVSRGGSPVGSLGSFAAPPPYAPRPALERVTDRRLPAGVLYPSSHVTGRKLPVLVDVYGGPLGQEVLAVRSRWVARQWFAEQGFAVVVVDNRGTPGVAPSFEKVVHRRLADVILTDQVEALNALVEKHPDLDLTRVAIRGWSFGGWLAGLAVLRRPDVYHCGIAGAPVADWTLYDTAYTERYLGLPDDSSEVYDHHSLLTLALDPPTRAEDARPLLLVHGLADDNVVAAHTLRLSAALLQSGRPHAVIPLPAATHMAAGGIAEKLLRLELDFLIRSLPD
jgi:dipeptidyl-peptidase-4